MDATQPIEDCFLEEDGEAEKRQREPETERIATLKVFKNGHIPETEIPLYAGENVLGRDPAACSVLLPVPSVSGRHAVISITVFRSSKCSDDGAAVETLVWDMGSLNGTRKGRLKLTPHVRYALSDGESVVLADLPCQYISLDISNRVNGCVSAKEKRESLVLARSAPTFRQGEGNLLNDKEHHRGGSFPPVPSWCPEDDKPRISSAQSAHKQPEVTLVPESDSDEESTCDVSDSSSSRLCSANSSFLTPAKKLILESEDEISVCPSSASIDRFRQRTTLRESIQAGSEFILKMEPRLLDEFHMDSDTDVEEEESERSKTAPEAPEAEKSGFLSALHIVSGLEQEGGSKAGPRSKADQPPEVEMASSEDLHLDSDTDVEEEQEERSKTGPRSKAEQAPEVKMVTSEDLQLDSDTDVEEEQEERSKTGPRSKADQAPEVEMASSEDLHLDNDLDFEVSGTSKARSDNQSPGSFDKNLSPVDCGMDGCTEVEEEDYKREKSNQSRGVDSLKMNTDSPVVLHEDNDTDLEDEGTEGTVTKPDVQTEVAFDKDCATDVEDDNLKGFRHREGESDVESTPGAHLCMDSDTDVDEENARNFQTNVEKDDEDNFKQSIKPLPLASVGDIKEQPKSIFINHNNQFLGKTCFEEPTQAFGHLEEEWDLQLTQAYETVREEQGEPLCHNLTSTYSTFSTADTQLIATVKPEADLDEQRLDDSHLSTADNLLTASTPRREDETQSFPLFTAQTQLIWEEEGKEIDPTQLIEGDSIADNRKKELCIKEGRTSNPAETAQEGSSSSLFIAETQPMFEEEEATHSNLSVENFKIPRIQNWGVSEDPAHHVENISSSYIVIAETQLMYGEGEASNQEHKRRTISNGSMEGEKVYTPSACIPQTEPDCEETEPFLKTTWTSPQRGKYEKVKEVPQSDPTCEASSETPNKRRADDHKPAAETQALRVDQNEHVSTVISTREMDRESSTVTDEEPKEDKSLSRKTVNRRSRRVKPEPIQRASPETQLEKAQEGEEKELVENKRQRRGCEQREQGEKCQWQEQKDKKLGKEKADCSSSSLNSDQSATPEQEPRSMRGRGRGKRTSVKQPPNARQSRRLQETEQMVHSRSTSRSSERTADVGTSTQGTRGKSRGRIVKPQEVKVLPQAKAAGRRRRCSGAELLTMAEEDAKMVEDKSAVPQTSSRGRKRSAAPSEHDPSPTGKISRRTVASQTYKVLFTGLTDDDGERVVSSLGGTLAKGVSDMTHLVTDKARRTVKFLCAVARGVPIVTPDWLKKCGSAGRFLSTDDFILKDVGQEKKFNFCLQTSLQAALNQPLLKDYEIHVTPSVMPEPSQMKEIIMCCGGRFLQKMPSAPKEHVVVVSCEQDLRLCSKALSLALPVVTAEFLLSGILQQRVDLQAFSLASSLDSSVQPAASKPAATGRGRK